MLPRHGCRKNFGIHPSAGDAGEALGAALLAWHHYLNHTREVRRGRDSQRGSFLGPKFDPRQFLHEQKIPHLVFADDELFEHVARLLAAGKIVGWFQGRMEFGPRALGSRSMIGDARSSEMQSVMNLKIKYRESFRPFAPSVLRERVADYFEMNTDSPYMLLVAPVLEKRRLPFDSGQKELWGIDLLNVPRSDIPSVTHIDYSARIQTVHEETNPRYYKLLKVFEEKTGYATC